MLRFVSILRGEGRGGHNEGNHHKISGKPLIETMCVLIAKRFPKHSVQDCSFPISLGKSCKII